MIEIINTRGLTAHLYPDTSITIERNNPLFLDSENYFEDITYSFKMPADAWNKEFFKSGHLVEAVNAVYELDVQTFVNGENFFTGILSYSFAQNDFKALLKVNFGAVAKKIKDVKLSEIYTGDGNSNVAISNAHMLETCTNPKNFPYCFFTIYNDDWSAIKGENFKPFVNYWNHNTQKFEIAGASSRNTSTAVPFWKLKNIIIKLMAYLGFQTDGTWINDLENDKIYIYNIKALDSIYDSVLFLPQNLKITDFLKIIKARFNINFNYDLFTGRVNIDSGISILKSSDIFPLSQFVESIAEINVTEVKGYKLTLKPDDTDELFKDQVNLDNQNHVPTNELVIGNGTTSIEINASTLKEKALVNYTMPAAKQRLIFSLADANPDFPLRFLYYDGMKVLPDGKVFPSASPIELKLEDGIWFRMLNDSKTLKLLLAIPLNILSKINGSKKISFLSKEGFLTNAMIEKVTYIITNSNQTLVKAEIECKMISVNYNTTIALNPVNADLESGATVSAFFDQQITGLNSIEIEIYFQNVLTPESQTIPITKTINLSITESTDNYGVGGTKAYYWNHKAQRNVANSFCELRVKTGVPKYGMIGNKKFTFIKRDDYYYTNDTGSAADLRGIWIVF